MAARRGKTQARRNHGQGGLPGWAWMVLGIVLTVAVVLLVPKWLKSDGDGLWRPQPNPDARPARAADAGEEAVDAPSSSRPRPATPAADEEGPEYDFYTLLPGKEVALSDSELAATERAEAQRLEAQRQEQLAQAAALPRPVEGEPAPSPGPVATAPAASAAASADGASYLLQAGAFQASGQAEELKARIALLGLGARVESAQIGDKTIYRVRMGPYGTASDLAEAKRKLASGGLPAMAIKVK